MKIKVKNIVITGLVIVSFVFVVLSVQYNHFPFDILKSFKHYILPPEQTGRITLTSKYDIVTPIVNNNTGIYITYGQSNSTNHGQIGYEVESNVYMFYNNNTFIYRDPSLGGTGLDGSVWGMVGDKLIEQGVYDEVIFSNCGWGGKSINELKKGEIFEYLTENYTQLIEKFGRVDGILFHQGESDNVENGDKYYYDSFVEFLENLESNKIQTKIYLSRVSYCGLRLKNDELTSVQNKLIDDFSNVLEGPNTDLLTDKKYRLPDECHFSLEGYDKFSDMWVELLTK